MHSRVILPVGKDPPSGGFDPHPHPAIVTPQGAGYREEKSMRRLTLFAVLGALVLALGAGVAFAATFTGTNGPDRIQGTSGNDSISGGRGNDFLSGNGGRDDISGGFRSSTTRSSWASST
jgi:Ca2+-binding RTX toxin-like protein